MISILYEDKDIIVVEKPPGIESQGARGFEPDMVSEIRKHINKLSTNSREAYVGVIHRLDKPVGGIMVYAKNKKAAASLSKQVSNHEMKKVYRTLVCGKPVDNFGIYVDYLWKEDKTNTSQIVEKGKEGAKEARLSYRVLGSGQVNDQEVSYLEVALYTGRHHQIRVQMAGHKTPVLGDRKYNPDGFSGRGNLALWACSLSFFHPVTGQKMEFFSQPKGQLFSLAEKYVK